MSVEKGTSYLLRSGLQNDRPLLGSPGINNEPFDDELTEVAEAEVEVLEDKEKELRMSDAAQEIGSRVTPHAVAPPARPGPEVLHG